MFERHVECALLVKGCRPCSGHFNFRPPPQLGHTRGEISINLSDSLTLSLSLYSCEFSEGYHPIVRLWCVPAPQVLAWKQPRQSCLLEQQRCFWCLSPRSLWRGRPGTGMQCVRPIASTHWRASSELHRYNFLVALLCFSFPIFLRLLSLPPFSLLFSPFHFSLGTKERRAWLVGRKLLSVRDFDCSAPTRIRRSPHCPQQGRDAFG